MIALMGQNRWFVAAILGVFLVAALTAWLLAQVHAVALAPVGALAVLALGGVVIGFARAAAARRALIDDLEDLVQREAEGARAAAAYEIEMLRAALAGQGATAGETPSGSVEQRLAAAEQRLLFAEHRLSLAERRIAALAIKLDLTEDESG